VDTRVIRAVEDPRAHIYPRPVHPLTGMRAVGGDDDELVVVVNEERASWGQTLRQPPKRLVDRPQIIEVRVPYKACVLGEVSECSAIERVMKIPLECQMRRVFSDPRVHQVPEAIEHLTEADRSLVAVVVA